MLLHDVVQLVYYLLGYLRYWHSVVLLAYLLLNLENLAKWNDFLSCLLHLEVDYNTNVVYRYSEILISYHSHDIKLLMLKF